ncbi:hypothetical protein [Sulfitobacter aestuariivivens]|uniref:Uncharacterized protein n=1 Tax=Sulfitobacter aestuariivivens TaxID=2766981 RepID=A0A927D1L3_9RHOB|nr:hypothetical protein [Sulfitobacter aestuariivivens]MBD3663365.1 hypothetical protein [Sulfitobacter aestuariivivens]
MPFLNLLVIWLAVLMAAAATVWLFTLGGPGLMVAAIPALLIAAVAIRVLRR